MSETNFADLAYITINREILSSLVPPFGREESIIGAMVPKKAEACNIA